MHGAGCVRQWFHTAEPLGERRYENWNTEYTMGQCKRGFRKVTRVHASHILYIPVRNLTADTF